MARLTFDMMSSGAGILNKPDRPRGRTPAGRSRGLSASNWLDGIVPSANRKSWTTTGMMVAFTIAAAIASYSLSLKVSGEAREVEKLVRQNRALESELKSLDAELRVRMRLPQLQRWNDEVLGLTPIRAEQYLDEPLHLANYGEPLPDRPAATMKAAPVIPAMPAPTPARPAMEGPAVQLAVAPQATRAAAPRLVSASAPAQRSMTSPRSEAPAGARPQPVAGLDPLLVAAIEEAAHQEARHQEPRAKPADLLHHISLENAAASRR